MHPIRKRRLIILLTILVAVGASSGLTLYALRQNINLFYTPSQVMAGKAPIEHRFRIGGLVVKGSVHRNPKTLNVSFNLTDEKQTVTVRYHGILPDLFREGQGIIALGKLNAKGIFIAQEVLAKHDENYMPPEVKAALAKRRD